MVFGVNGTDILLVLITLRVMARRRNIGKILQYKVFNLTSTSRRTWRVQGEIK